MNHPLLSGELVESVLARLGFSSRPEPGLASLGALYAAWGRSVPFDNVRKLIHLRAGEAGPFPGGTPEDFFEAWLKHGTGGTCWSGSGGFQALLQALGFAAVCSVGTMLVAPGLPPNHGTVQVTFGQDRYLVDCSMLYGEPLRLDENTETRVLHPARGVRCNYRDGHWYVAWRPLQRLEGLECRLEYFGASREEYAGNYEKTRAWSPFNYELSVRLNRGESVVGTALGRGVSLHPDGSVGDAPLSVEERARLLTEEIGMSEEIVSKLPADIPTPPPPGSRTALTAS